MYLDHLVWSFYGLYLSFFWIFIFLIACIFTFHASSMLQLTDQHFIYFKFDCGCDIPWHCWCMWEGLWVCICDLCICWIPVFQWSMSPILSVYIFKDEGLVHKELSVAVETDSKNSLTYLKCRFLSERHALGQML